MPKLIIQHLDREWTVELREGPNVIGRSSKCQVPVGDANISREHCEVVLANGVVTLVDRGSMNGTLLNGGRVWERRLEPGDRIHIGQTYIWFEVKRDSGAARKSAGDTKVKTERMTAPPAEAPASGSKPASGSAQPAVPPAPKKTEARRTAAALVKDIGAWTSSGLNLRRLLIAVSVAVALVGLTVLALVLPGRGTRGGEDKENLLRDEGGFEWAAPGKPTNWALHPPGSSSVSVTEAAARTGKRALELRKGPAPAETQSEVEYSERIAVGSHKSFEVSAWAKWGDFAGSAAVKVAWLRDGAVLFEEFSAPVSKGADWIAIRDTFDVPPGVRELRLALATAGRAGLIYFDDVRIVGKPAGKAREEMEAGPFRILVARGGAVTILRGAHAVMSDLHFRLENDLEGATSQLLSPASVRREEGRIVVQGAAAHPVSGAAVPYEMSIFWSAKDDLGIAYEFKASDLAQVGRVDLWAVVPRADRLRLPEEPVAQLEFTAGEDYRIVYVDRRLRPAVREGNRLVQPFAVTDTEGKVLAAFRLRGLADRASRKDPRAEARDLTKDQPFRALQVLRAAQGDSTLDESAAREIAALISELEQRESEDWRIAESRGLAAELVALQAELEAAGVEVDRYERLWSGEPYLSKARTLRKRIADVTAVPGGSDRPRKLLDRARQCLEAGRKALAEAILAGIVASYGSTETGEEARRMLDQIRSGG
ncbi:MAG: FHA domain-containing protein [Planctomycetes bacterium]|nr:FHA domain-containing protein [Planctomycetota bacterium]